MSKKLLPYFILPIVLWILPCFLNAARLELTQKEKDFLKENSTIRVHNEVNYPPYNFYKDGKAQGYSIDYMNLLAKKIGINVEYVSGYEWNEFMKLIQHGELDVMLNIKRTPGREKFLHFTEPYAATKKAIFTKNKTLKNLKSLNNQTVCVPKGFYIEHFLEAYYPKVILIRKNSILECIQSVENQESKATVSSYTIGSYLIHNRNLKIPFIYKVPDKRLIVGLTLATASKMEILRDILQKAMYLVTEKEREKLAKKWIGIVDNEDIFPEKIEYPKPFSIKKIVTMCNNPNWAPIEFSEEDGRIQGIAIDTLKLLEKRLNIVFKSVKTKSWIESQQYLKEGKCDILPAATSTENRKEYANFTTPYLVYKLAIITRSDKPFVDSIESISDKIIARKRGSGLISKLKKRYPHINILETNDYLESLKKVSSGKAYCTIATLPVASYFINHFTLQDLHVGGYTDMLYRLSIAVNKDNTTLLNILDSALAHITPQEQRDIYNKWVNERLVESIDKRYIYYPIVGILIILLLMYYRQHILAGVNKNLKKEIDEKVNENLIQHQFIQEQAKMAAMGEMIGVIAHQWRQPLNALGLSIQNLSYYYEDGLLDKLFIEKFIDKNVKTIGFMNQTIDDFSGFFRADKREEDFSVRSAIESIFYMQSLDLEKHTIKYKIYGDDFILFGHKSEFQQVILNLISNAKDALVENTLSQDRYIEIYLEDYIVLFIDNGGGIDEGILEKIFESRYTTKKEGMGIGLHMSKIIIEENLKGKMSAYSKGDGTVIVLDFKGLINA